MDQAEIRIKSTGEGIEDALDMTDYSGKRAGLERKEVLRLRLLAEELIGLIRGIAGDVEADYRIEHEGKQFRISLDSDIKLTREMRKGIISLSSKGENAKAVGVMGRIREMVAVALLPGDVDASMMSGVSLGTMSMGGASGMGTDMTTAQIYSWSMQEYKKVLESKAGYNKEAEKRWDEVEKSIVANIADDIVVSVEGSHVEIVIYKEFEWSRLNDMKHNSERYIPKPE